MLARLFARLPPLWAVVTGPLTGGLNSSATTWSFGSNTYGEKFAMLFVSG